MVVIILFVLLNVIIFIVDFGLILDIFISFKNRFKVFLFLNL